MLITTILRISVFILPRLFQFLYDQCEEQVDKTWTATNDPFVFDKATRVSPEEKMWILLQELWETVLILVKPWLHLVILSIASHGLLPVVFDVILFIASVINLYNT